MPSPTTPAPKPAIREWMALHCWGCGVALPREANADPTRWCEPCEIREFGD